MIEGMHAYQMFMALKLHFTSDYDYIKYNGQVRLISDAALQTRNDYNQFRGIERRYRDDLETFIVANFVEAPDQIKWIGDIYSLEADQRYATWRLKQESLSYKFLQDIRFMVAQGFNTNVVRVEEGEQFPPMFRYYMVKKIALETVMAMNIYLNHEMFKAWKRSITDGMVYPIYHRLFTKYEPFFKADRDKLVKIVDEEILNADSI